MSSTSLRDLVLELAVAWLELSEEYTKRAHDSGRSLRVTCTHRTPTEQFKLYCVGRRELNGAWVPDDDRSTSIVTHCDGFTKKSKHNAHPSQALDFCVEIYGKVSWDVREYEPVGRLAEARGLVWGGRWTKFPDCPHIEVPSS